MHMGISAVFYWFIMFLKVGIQKNIWSRSQKQNHLQQ